MARLARRLQYDQRPIYSPSQSVREHHKVSPIWSVNLRARLILSSFTNIGDIGRSRFPLQSDAIDTAQAEDEGVGASIEELEAFWQELQEFCKPA
jgi:hypothetical protein